MERDGRIYLTKDCPDCGVSETLISSDSARYHRKRDLDEGYDYRSCGLDCPDCKHDRPPRFAFVDVTNRCNMNCPICVDNVPGLGFEFDPPLEYFDNLFERLSRHEPRPTIALFGGEPTVREDLLDIIELSKAHGFRTRVLTNGLKLADEEYCRRLVETRVTILVAYDGANPDTYRRLRGNPRVVEAKQKAIDNLGKLLRPGRRKVILIMCVAKGMNDSEVAEYLRFCHERRDFLSGVHFMPLAHTWDKARFDFEPDRITTEDIEATVGAAFPGEAVEFIPAGFASEFTMLTRYVGAGALPFFGAHPNCESIYLLVSNGERYVPVEHFLNVPLSEFGRSLRAVEKRLVAREKAWGTSLFGRRLSRLHLKNVALRTLGIAGLLRTVFRHLRLGRLFKGRGPVKALHALGLAGALLLHRKSSNALRRHTNMQEVLQLVVLPFEDNNTLETERMERCPSAHAYYDPNADRVRYVPICAWRLHNDSVMREIGSYYSAMPVKEKAGQPVA